MANDTEQHDEMKAGSAGEEMVLLFLFGVLLAGVLAVLYFDFRTLNGNSVPFNLPFLKTAPTTSPITPAKDQDQIRRYSPQTKVDFGPGGKAKLPGVAGNADTLLSGSMTFHNAGNGVISAIGLIEAGTTFRFEDFIKSLDDVDPVTEVYLHSPGGSVRDAIDMSRFIRDRKITTHITKNGYCASSCPLVFSGGAKRSIGEPAVLGVHQVFTSDTATGTLQQGIANAQAISADAQELLVDMGVDPRAWIKAMATSKDQLYLFTEKEIEELNWTLE